MSRTSHGDNTHGNKRGGAGPFPQGKGISSPAKPRAIVEKVQARMDQQTVQGLPRRNRVMLQVLQADLPIPTWSIHRTLQWLCRSPQLHPATCPHFGSRSTCGGGGAGSCYNLHVGVAFVGLQSQSQGGGRPCGAFAFAMGIQRSHGAGGGAGTAQGGGGRWVVSWGLQVPLLPAVVRSIGVRHGSERGGQGTGASPAGPKDTPPPQDYPLTTGGREASKAGPSMGPWPQSTSLPHWPGNVPALSDSA